MTITIDIPQQIQDHLQAEWSDLDRHALEGLVTEAFRRGKLSSQQVGQALGIKDRWAVIDFLSSRGLYPAYDKDDFEQDMDTLAEINGRHPQ